MKPLGKRRCEILKNVRKQIAKANGIKYEPVECTHEGDCPGTCPQCEAEVKYIEQELCKKMGGMKKAAAVLVGSTITVGALSVSSCTSRFRPLEGSVARKDTLEEVLMGEPVENFDTLQDKTDSVTCTLPVKEDKADE